jgi:hypothetical protein
LLALQNRLRVRVDWIVGIVVVVEVLLGVILLARLHLATIAFFAEGEIKVVALEANPILSISCASNIRLPP